MASIIEGQVGALKGTLMQEHRDAMAGADVRDQLMPVCLSLATSLVASTHQEQNEGKLTGEVREGCRLLCETTLGVFTISRRTVADIASDGHSIDQRDIKDLDAAVLTIRDLLADLLDKSPPRSVCLPDVRLCRPGINEDQPPQSWFEEDHASLAGPF